MRRPRNIGGAERVESFMLDISTLSKMHEITIRDAASEDAIRLADIYSPYVLKTAISFEECKRPAIPPLLPSKE
jgi:hypothetical protein